MNQLIGAVIHTQENPPQKRFLVGCARHHSSWARPAPHGASRLVQAKSAWSVKTRHAPSRHCRDARVYGHTTTAMHDMTPVALCARYLSVR